MSATNATPANGHSPQDDLPSLAALFLIKFDLKVGYTITWKRSLPDRTSPLPPQPDGRLLIAPQSSSTEP
ncbi:putative duf2347 superfamily protein [Neofusicoccum parvum UCRNP2]|uniref:Uncharacterized protein LTHEOB_2571 n=2 Tax=Neofusicoccum parvum TaxID=310453 RepID=A0ACB5RX23_9PEZI|nr:putative duf2347 superfamily protein [Neofusicoccum parvum UCRNP2]GME25067.1 uncharacterized protein LTHEOB_2571 [Neofusicoccum parvum]